MLAQAVFRKEYNKIVTISSKISYLIFRRLFSSAICLFCFLSIAVSLELPAPGVTAWKKSNTSRVNLHNYNTLTDSSQRLQPLTAVIASMSWQENMELHSATTFNANIIADSYYEVTLKLPNGNQSSQSFAWSKFQGWSISFRWKL